MKYMFINSLVLRSEIKRFHITIKWVLVTNSIDLNKKKLRT